MVGFKMITLARFFHGLPSGHDPAFIITSGKKNQCVLFFFTTFLIGQLSCLTRSLTFFPPVNVTDWIYYFMDENLCAWVDYLPVCFYSHNLESRIKFYSSVRKRSDDYVCVCVSVIRYPTHVISLFTYCSCLWGVGEYSKVDNLMRTYARSVWEIIVWLREL